MAIGSFDEAFTAIADVLAGAVAAIPPALHAALDESQASIVPPERLWRFGELVYANLDAAPPALRDVAADVLIYAVGFGFYGLGDGGRGQLMADALRGGTVDAGSPAPDARFVIAPRAGAINI